MDFYKGKRVLITGHTGFKGAWLCQMLINAGAEVTGYALNPPTKPSLFEIANISGKNEFCYWRYKRFIKIKRDIYKNTARNSFSFGSTADSQREL